MNPSLITMAGPSSGPINVRNVSNLEAGLAFLGLVNKLYPGITWGELHAMGMGRETMGRSFWDKVGGALGDVKDTVSDVVSKTVKVAGDSAGAAVRLVTDEKVIDGASRIGAAYASGGQSEAAKSVGEKLLDLVSHIGSTVKETSDSAAASAPGIGGLRLPGGVLPWALGGTMAFYVLARTLGGSSRGGRR